MTEEEQLNEASERMHKAFKEKSKDIGVDALANIVFKFIDCQTDQIQSIYQTLYRIQARLSAIEHRLGPE